ncbi:uncharacterized protein LY79DRAFT_545092 [Colletotrichum navitas]|uniref:Uncharacterized protein n=1 Tax=Colletotrichum navitas TaxID=681940 RepID=A0AAD8V6G4_9PEZI|nr:uncharacterized protein LY79DRAFT_545092 [Colletotrichum navitas]KAK1596012.1 hypothetical protein LY79DRAFT_545092 [Colletotrichum navitas]
MELDEGREKERWASGPPKDSSKKCGPWTKPTAAAPRGGHNVVRILRRKDGIER